MREILVLTGRAGAGKTTLAMQLVTKQRYVRVRFAGPLKAMASAFGLTHDEIDGAKKDKPSMTLREENLDGLLGALPSAFAAASMTPTGEQRRALGRVVRDVLHAGDVIADGVGSTRVATPRALMQAIGTEWGRKVMGESCWTDAWERALGDVPKGRPIVVDDCRFPNEYEVAMRVGDTVVVRITRPEVVTLLDAKAQAHESETHVLPFNLTVANNTYPDLVVTSLATRVNAYRTLRAADVPAAG